MLFNFRLRPVDDIGPWHDGDGSNPHLHWFGLTDGVYWIDTGDAELFRYSDDVAAKWRHEFANDAWLTNNVLPYVDYQVVRLWEDVLDVLPGALESVPKELARVLGPTGPWMSWVRHAKAVLDVALPDGEHWDPLEDALEDAASWWWRCRLDCGYLVAGPNIWFWREGSEMHVQWDNRGRDIDGVPAWEATIGQTTMPLAAFLRELRDFDMRLIGEMAARVEEIRAGWARPEVAIDVDTLGYEQRQRAKWMDRQMESLATQEPTDWNAVFRAIERIEALPGFAMKLFA
jgi:Family of unknown function (DUF5984)